MPGCRREGLCRPFLPPERRLGVTAVPSRSGASPSPGGKALKILQILQTPGKRAAREEMKSVWEWGWGRGGGGRADLRRHFEIPFWDLAAGEQPLPGSCILWDRPHPGACANTPRDQFSPRLP